MKHHVMKTHNGGHSHICPKFSEDVQMGSTEQALLIFALKCLYHFCTQYSLACVAESWIYAANRLLCTADVRPFEIWIGSVQKLVCPNCVFGYITMNSIDNDQ